MNRTISRMAFACLAAGALTVSGPVWRVAATAAQSEPQRQGVYNGLNVTVTAVERAPSAGLTDCPAGANIVRGMTRPGEEFAIVMLDLEVLPDFTPGPMPRPVVADEAGEVYHTAAAFVVDGAAASEFSCGFPFRVPAGTALTTFTLDSLVLDLTGL